MADQEIAKHTKKVVRVLANREHGVAHKLREMALEIFTIVFAVTLSIWLHGLSEHSHQQQEVRTFLLGLKADLASDIGQLESIKAAYRRFDDNHAYLAALDAAAAPDPERFEAAYAVAHSNIFFMPITSRYEGFKSSGKLGNIEDEKLLGNILELYHSVHPQILNSEGGWRTGQRALHRYLDLELDLPDETAARYRLVVAPKAKRLLKRMATQPQLYERYQNYADGAALIIKAIDKAYPDAAKG
jgi:hypothetical protein